MEEISYTGRVRRSIWWYPNDNKQVNESKQPTEYHPSNRWTALTYMNITKPNKNWQNTFQMTYTAALDKWAAENQMKACGIPSNNDYLKDTWPAGKPNKYLWNIFQMTKTVALGTWLAENQMNAGGLSLINNYLKCTCTNSKPQSLYHQPEKVHQPAECGWLQSAEDPLTWGQKPTCIGIRWGLRQYPADQIRDIFIAAIFEPSWDVLVPHIKDHSHPRQGLWQPTRLI